MKPNHKYSILPFNQCALCGINSDLKLSHIIPRYFGKSIKGGSQTIVDALNSEKTPKPQDITKVYLLCGDCEGKINKWETLFRNRIMPKNKSLFAPVIYGEWMLKFAVSISWRVLTYLKYSRLHLTDNISNKNCEKFFPAIKSDSNEDAEAALNVWKDFLMGERNDVGIFKQRIIILNGDNFPYENSNVVGFTIFQEDGLLTTHALMKHFIILGFIKESSSLKWEGTEIDPVRGELGKQQKVPKVYFNWIADMFQEIETSSLIEWQNRKK
ncbi:hypothetical protein [Nodularia sp. UHCC 0506]|uniref:hypothetical protein n=1 Tax=Nodularia sp. UHCC 0506 TaxID=3110243 RepID=UPI002B220C2D|nr:hypothetical protein [Nodularia sp. UHCC 0506]MEA5514195.1 hypothetical protein [Nodularia sp. UHCC 0506]